MNTTECLEIASLIAPDRLAVVFENHRLTYETIVERINRLATALISLGIFLQIIGARKMVPPR